jgi:hypothetical protein
LKSKVARFSVDNDLLKLSTSNVDIQIKVQGKTVELDKQTLENNNNLSRLEAQLQLNLKKGRIQLNSEKS